MSTTRDFVSSTIADGLLPLFRRSFEDVVYETLDKRAVPTRADFKDLRDVVNGLRGQVTGAARGVTRLAESEVDVQDKLDAIVARLDALDARLDKLSAMPAKAPTKQKAAPKRAAPKKAAPKKAAPKKAAPKKAHTGKSCQVRGCKDSIRSKGFCSKHYQAWRRGRLKGFPPKG
jgi:hypothetical protein